MGRPIFIDRMGSIKVDKLLDVVSEEWCFRSLYYLFELSYKWRFLSCSAVFDRQITASFNVIDLTNFGMHLWNKKTMSLLKAVLSIS